MKYTKYLRFIFINSFLLIIGCQESAKKVEPQEIPLKNPFQSKDKLFLPLLEGDFAKFYQNNESDHQEAKNRLAALKPEQRDLLNYGALVNAGLITKENRDLFKPDIKKIESYVYVANDLKCYLNASLYSMANSAFFDELLEIDRLKSDAWQKRPAAHLAIAERILRTLREAVYEIRLGPNTTPERIAKARNRHFESLENLNALDLIASFYHELFSAYEIQTIEVIGRDKNSGVIGHQYVDLNPIPIEASEVKQSISQYKAHDTLDGFGHIGNLSSCLLSGTLDWNYFTALFIILDPWGATARYLTATLKFNDTGAEKAVLRDSFHGKLVFDLSDKLGKIHFFFNDFNTAVLFGLRDIASKKVLGFMKYTVKSPDKNNQLIAKTRHSSNHQIAELFIFARRVWETHTFFGPGGVSKEESAGGDGYIDSIYFYQTKDMQ